MWEGYLQRAGGARCSSEGLCWGTSLFSTFTDHCQVYTYSFKSLPCFLCVFCLFPLCCTLDEGQCLWGAAVLALLAQQWQGWEAQQCSLWPSHTRGWWLSHKGQHCKQLCPIGSHTCLEEQTLFPHGSSLIRVWADPFLESRFYS